MVNLVNFKTKLFQSARLWLATGGRCGAGELPGASKLQNSKMLDEVHQVHQKRCGADKHWAFLGELGAILKFTEVHQVHPEVHQLASPLYAPAR